MIEVAENVAYRSEEAEAIAKLVAKEVVANSNVPTEELSSAIGEIEEETQILGPSYIKLHVIDPAGTLQLSGLVSVDEDGIFREVEIEFPAESSRKWVLCDVEGALEVLEPNFVMVFQDKLSNDLRHYWGPKWSPPGTQTRAQFVRDLLEEAGIKPVIPGVDILQPVEEETKGEQGQTQIETATSKAQRHAEINKNPDTGKLARLQYIFAAELAALTGLNSKLVCAWCLAEESGGNATAYEARSYNDWLNIGPFLQNTAFATPQGGAKYTAKFLKGEEGGASAGILGIIKSVGQGVEAEIAAISHSGWDGENGYEGGQTLRELYAEIGSAETPTVTPSATEAQSDVGQLKRGTDDSPDEDSGECIKRLAQQVDWFAFPASSNRQSYYYYMTGPELAKQTPALKVKWFDNQITKRDGTKEEGVILLQSRYSLDQTAFEYQRTHKVRKKTQRKSKSVKPTSPSEVKLHLQCAIGEFIAGMAVRFEDSGVLSEVGRWIIAQTTRKVFKDPYTEIICQPPEQPLPEPKETSKEEAPATVGGATATGGGTGGYVNPLKEAQGLVAERIDQGVDYAMAPGSPILAIGNCEIIGEIPGWFEDEPFVWYKLLDGEYAGKYVYLAEQINLVVKPGQHINAGQRIATYASSGTGIEIGWALENGKTYAKGAGGGYVEGQMTAAGAAFSKFLVSLGAPAGLTEGRTVTGTYSG